MKINDALKIVEDRIATFQPGTFIGIGELIQLDIARSLRKLTTLSEEGLKFSHSLATLMIDDSKEN